MTEDHIEMELTLVHDWDVSSVERHRNPAMRRFGHVASDSKSKHYLRELLPDQRWMDVPTFHSTRSNVKMKSA